MNVLKKIRLALGIAFAGSEFRRDLGDLLQRDLDRALALVEGRGCPTCQGSGVDEDLTA